ncbi:MAG: class I SAM-dependent methyltransferase [Acidimicrobiia bacterium]
MTSTDPTEALTTPGHPIDPPSIALPARSNNRLAVRITKDAQRQLRSGHPWVYDSSITSVNGEGAPGDLAVIFDEQRKFVAIGLWDPSSPIRIKILHRGRPATIDGTWWRKQISASIERRSALLEPAGDTTAYRCVNGESDGLPGLILDRYDDHYVLKLYSPGWFPHLVDVVPAIVETTQCASLVLRWSRAVAASNVHGLHEGMALHGAAPTAPVMFRENGLRFEADLIAGQKTGFFLDQRDNRARVRTLTRGARVLDLFSCTGGFSVSAAAGGAVDVTSVDISPGALAAAERNMAHNADVPTVRHSRHRIIEGDAFRVMEQLARSGQRYDVIIIDPPPFAQNQASVDRALSAYAKLTELGLQLLHPGAVLVQASCSSRVTRSDFFNSIFDVADARGIRLEEIDHTGHALDHPATFPQAMYLKALFARRG